MATASHAASHAHVHLFLGPELGEKNDAVAALRGSLEKKAAVEVTTFYATETPAREAAQTIANGSLFSQARLFIIKCVEAFKKNDAAILAAGLAEMDADTVVIMLSDGGERDVDKELVAAAGDKKIFWEMFENRKVEWLRDFWRRDGWKIEEDALAVILELVENNTEALRRECARLSLFLDKTRAVTAADIEKWLSHTREESAFTLFAAIAARDFPKALTIMRVLLGAKTAPVALFAGLNYCFKRLRDYCALVESGRANDFEFRKIGFYSPAMRRDYDAFYKNYHAARKPAISSRAVALTAEADFQCRSSFGIPDDILLDWYLYRIFAL